MFTIPPMPPWDGMHPLVVHFPIALMFAVPVTLLMALVWQKHTRALLVCSALLMVLGTFGAWLATSTGSAAEELAEGIAGVDSALDRHEELGEAARNFMTVLAAVLCVGVGACFVWPKKIGHRAVVAGGLGYLLAHAACTLAVANAAHAGGRLVHEFGVQARTGGAAPLTTERSGSSSRERARDDDDD
ncbi:MAG: hypothetical protein KDA20_06065 [Phycisphaerales bacterium]|nr:hypothetical protein [Phycisphaerales bacterium]